MRTGHQQPEHGAEIGPRAAPDPARRRIGQGDQQQHPHRQEDGVFGIDAGRRAQCRQQPGSGRPPLQRVMAEDDHAGPERVQRDVVIELSGEDREVEDAGERRHRGERADRIQQPDRQPPHDQHRHADEQRTQRHQHPVAPADDGDQGLGHPGGQGGMLVVDELPPRPPSGRLHHVQRQGRLGHGRGRPPCQELTQRQQRERQARAGPDTAEQTPDHGTPTRAARSDERCENTGIAIGAVTGPADRLRASSQAWTRRRPSAARPDRSRAVPPAHRPEPLPAPARRDSPDRPPWRR